jgi:hypothetical protein
MYSSNKYRTKVEGKYIMAVTVGRHKEERPGKNELQEIDFKNISKKIRIKEKQNQTDGA